MDKEKIILSNCPQCGKLSLYKGECLNRECQYPLVNSWCNHCHRFKYDCPYDSDGMSILTGCDKYMVARRTMKYF